MSISLSNLITNLSEINEKKIDCDKLNELKCKFPSTWKFCDNDDEEFKLMLRKGVYQYEYMSNQNKFDEDKLPSKEYFSSDYNKETISDDYDHALNVFNKYCKNLGDYHDLYVQSDTCQLADIFENFRKTCLNVYETEPCYCVSYPGLSWQARLKKLALNQNY